VALSKLSNGTFFKGANYTGAEVILFEPTRVEYDVPSNNPKMGNQDVVTATVTVFNTLDAEPEVLLGLRIGSKALTKDLAPLVAGREAVAARIELLPNSYGGNDFPVLRTVSPAAEEHVEAYIAKRDAFLSDENVPF
jgi:hypothetical protein